VVPHDQRLWRDLKPGEGLPEFVVVIEYGYGFDAKHLTKERNFVGLMTKKGGGIPFGKSVRCGEWTLHRESTLAYLFYSLKSAKAAANSAIVRFMLEKSSLFRVAVYATKLRRRDCRWLEEDMGAEVWPNPTDVIGALAAIR